MRIMEVSELKPHPKNNYFFDDIEGEPWAAFLESIETSGVIEPVIIDASDKTIISGHQRVRACKELEIKRIAVEERGFESEDERLKQLIETNIRQRGVGNTNAVKLGRCIKELERIYGVRSGSAGKADPTKLGGKTQSDLAEEIGVSSEQLRKYKSLTDLIPELQDAVQSGRVTATTAMGFVKKLSPEEQMQLAESIGGSDKVSGKEVEKYIAEIRVKDTQIQNLEFQNQQLHSANKALARQANQGSRVETVEVEVFPDDYEEAKKQAEIAVKDKEAMKRQYDEMAEKWKRSESEKQRILEEQDRPEAEQARRIRENSIFFCAGVSTFLEKFGGYSYLMGEINELPDKDRNAVLEAVKAINRWSEEMLNSTVSEVVE